MQIGNLPEKEFRVKIVKMLQDLGKRMEEKIEKMQQMFNKDLEELKNNSNLKQRKIIQIGAEINEIENRKIENINKAKI